MLQLRKSCKGSGILGKKAPHYAFVAGVALFVAGGCAVQFPAQRKLGGLVDDPSFLWICEPASECPNVITFHGKSPTMHVWPPGFALRRPWYWDVAVTRETLHVEEWKEDQARFAERDSEFYRDRPFDGGTDVRIRSIAVTPQGTEPGSLITIASEYSLWNPSGGRDPNIAEVWYLDAVGGSGDKGLIVRAMRQKRSPGLWQSRLRIQVPEQAFLGDYAVSLRVQTTRGWKDTAKTSFRISPRISTR